MLTLAQGHRLRDIAQSLRGCLRHPSPAVRASVGSYNDHDVDEAIEYIQRVIEQQDGFLAHGIIKAWHERSLAGVLGKIVGLRPCGRSGRM